MSTVNKLVLTVLALGLLLVVASRDPEGVGRMVAWVVTVGAKLLDGVAQIIIDLTGGGSTGH